MIRQKSQRLRMRNHIVDYKEEEVPEGENLVVENLFLEEDEEAEEVK